MQVKAPFYTSLFKYFCAPSGWIPGFYSLITLAWKKKKKQYVRRQKGLIH